MGSKEENLQEQVTTLKNQLDRKVNEMHSMQQIGKTLSSVLDRDRLLILIMDEVTRLMNAERGTLYIVDEEQGELWSKIAQKAEIKEIRLKIGVGIAGHVAKTGEVINIHDAYKDKRFDPTTDKKTGYHTRSILCMAIREPVKTEKQQGKIIAVLQILNKKDGIFTADDEDLLMSLGSQIAISLVNSRLYGVLDNKAKELNLLFNLEKELSRAFDVDDMLQKVVNMIPGALNVEHCLICLLDKDNEKFTSRFADHINKEALMSVPFVVHKGIIGQVMKKKSGYVSNDAGRDKHIDPDIYKALKLTAGQVACIPFNSEDKITGFIELINKTGDHGYFSENDTIMITSIASQISRGIENYRLKEEKIKADRLSAIGNMMSTIVHDLRTPMNNIYGFVDLMLDEDDRDTREEYAEIVNDQIKLLNNMTTDVLDFAKGKTTILPVKHPVDKLVKNFAKLFEEDIKRKGYKFEWSVDTASMIYIDPEKISRVFMNIMKNALEAMEKGGTFRLQAGEAADMIVFNLSDTGSGIPEEIRERLFDSFVTSGKEGGTGLGLAIVKKVIDDHKGQIEVESETGKGTTFKISIPRLK